MGSVAFLGMLVNNLRGNYMLADNQLSLKELTGTIGQGQFRLAGAVNLGVKGLDYALDLNLDRTSFKELSKIVGPMYENFVDGTISGNCTVKGNGVTPLRFVKTWKERGFLLSRMRCLRDCLSGPSGLLCAWMAAMDSALIRARCSLNSATAR